MLPVTPNIIYKQPQHRSSHIDFLYLYFRLSLFVSESVSLSPPFLKTGAETKPETLNCQSERGEGGEVWSEQRESIKGNALANPATHVQGGAMPKQQKQQGRKLEYVQQQVPKFLREHAHLLSSNSVRRDYVAEDDAEGTEHEGNPKVGGRRRVSSEDPDELEEDEKDLPVDIQAKLMKHRANEAFGKGEFTKAVEQFTKCIELDPQEAVYFSNRSAAYAKLKQYDEALSDGQKAVSLRPDWIKGYSRKAFALFCLEDFEAALKCYEKALDLDPADKQTRDSIARCHTCISNQKAGKHTFKRKKKKEGIDEPQSQAARKKSKVQVRKSMLSFSEED